MANKKITLSDLDTYLQDKLVNTIDSPISQTERVRAMNQIIQFMQSKANWDPTKRVKKFGYLEDETDYSITDDLNIDDLKDVKDIRDPDIAYMIFDLIDEKLMAAYIAESRVTNAYCIEERDNVDILRLIYRNGNTKENLAGMNSLTENGTWESDETNSDATTLAVDSDRKKEGGGSFKFNIDVDQSVNNYSAIKNESYTSRDLSSFENIGTFRVWADFQQLTDAQLLLIESIELRIGSDTSNYWSLTATGSITTGSFDSDWNRVSMNWRDATKTSSPDSSAITYIELRVNYESGMTDALNVRFDDLVLILPRDLEMTYFSEFMVKQADGTLLNEFTTNTFIGTEVLLLPNRHRLGFIELSAKLLNMQLKEEGSSKWLQEAGQAEPAFKEMMDDIGNTIVRDTPTVLPQGSFSERNDTRNQWD